ncbi:MAG: extracellular solute-binding protein [Actinomycetota bacterium]|nr:MAG: extracellular solute-binding protein [Actinomycetota bacterium]
MFGLKRLGSLFSALVVVSVVASSCGNSGGGSSAVGTGTSKPPQSTVNLSYAGSLEAAMNNVIGPAFSKASGYKLNGYPGGSVALANQIKEKLRLADVFLSASPSVNNTLSGSANGNLLTWYSDLASSPLVIGYNPNSKYASQLNSGDWFEVMRQSGFRLGRTDPKLDPKGTLTETLVKDEGTKIGDPSLPTQLLGSPENSAQIFPEETLVGRLESGQLDAGFFYQNEAKMAKIPYIETGISIGASFTISILNDAKNLNGAIAFVNFLYSAQGSQLLNSVGLLPAKPVVHGTGVQSGVKF